MKRKPSPTTILASAALFLLVSVPTAQAAPCQTISVVNQARISARAISRVEATVQTIELPALSRAWDTPCVHFGPGGWRLIISPLAPQFEGAGYHTYTCLVIAPYCPQAPLMVVYTRDTAWSYIFSHELIETLVDPTTERYLDGQLAEVCDPVEGEIFSAHGIELADWVMPAWFTHSQGPFDFRHRLGRAGEQA